MSNVLKPGISEISYRGLRFIIMDRPSDASMPQLIEQFKRANVKDVIRVCEPSYRTDLLAAAGIAVHDWQFDDGSPPPQEIIDKWFDLIKERHEQDENACFAVHCVAGLGRGPVMVALALMELGMKYEDTIEFVREKRRGAFNQKQLRYLSSYKPRNRLRNKKSECSIM
jgi:protein tyrosine phosphatase type 4A